MVEINVVDGWFGAAGSECPGGRSKGLYGCVVLASLTCCVVLAV